MGVVRARKRMLKEGGPRKNVGPREDGSTPVSILDFACPGFDPGGPSGPCPGPAPQAGDVVDRLYRLGEVIKRADEAGGTRITARIPAGEAERFTRYATA